MQIQRLTKTTGFRTSLDNCTHLETVFKDNFIVDFNISDDADGYDLTTLNKKKMELIRDLLSHTIERMEYLDE